MKELDSDVRSSQEKKVGSSSIADKSMSKKKKKRAKKSKKEKESEMEFEFVL